MNQLPEYATPDSTDGLEDSERTPYEKKSSDPKKLSSSGVAIVDT
jgi:hypothetical protein